MITDQKAPDWGGFIKFQFQFQFYLQDVNFCSVSYYSTVRYLLYLLYKLANRLDNYLHAYYTYLRHVQITCF